MDGGDICRGRIKKYNSVVGKGRKGREARTEEVINYHFAKI